MKKAKIILRVISLCFILSSSIFFYVAWRFYDPVLPYLAYGMLAGGGSFVFVSVLLFFISLFIGRNLEKLMQTGIAIETEYLNTENNQHIAINWQRPYFIQTVGIDTQGQKRVFKSSSVLFNPALLLKPGQKIMVYIDQNNPQKYWVDISFLQK